RRLLHAGRPLDRVDFGHVADPPDDDAGQLRASDADAAQLHQFRRATVLADAAGARHRLTRQTIGGPAVKGGTMAASFDGLERRAPEEREAGLFARLPRFLASVIGDVPGLGRWLGGVDPSSLTSRAALARLPVLHKADLMEMQAQEPPFGGFANPAQLAGGRVFLSPGPIWEPQGLSADPAQAARAFFAAGARAGDIVHNAFSYHMTPGGFMMDHGARALGCTVFPAGTGNTDMQVE